MGACLQLPGGARELERERERERNIERGREREKEHVAGLEVCCRQKLGLVAQATSPEETSEASKLATCHKIHVGVNEATSVE